MPLLLSIGGLLLQLVGSVIGRALIALGMSYVTFRGLNVGIDWLLAEIKSNISAMPAQAIQFLAYLWVDKAIAMMFSAYAAAAVIKMAGGTSMTRLVTKGGAS